MDTDLMSTREAAEVLGVSTVTLMRMVHDGRIQPAQFSPVLLRPQAYRFPRHEVLRVLEDARAHQRDRLRKATA